MTESVLRCPGCGAPASADALACVYCGVALATVTCPSCFAAIFAGSRFCAHCGAEATRELLDEAKPLHCPRCATARLQLLRLGSTPARECATCGGLWMEPSALQSLCDKHEEHAAVIGALGSFVPTFGTSLEPVHYFHCPVCGQLMNRANFAHASGVILDTCSADGVWLDRGKLRQVIEFVAAGGMTSKHRLENEQLASVHPNNRL